MGGQPRIIADRFIRCAAIEASQAMVTLGMAKVWLPTNFIHRTPDPCFAMVEIAYITNGSHPINRPSWRAGDARIVN